jgi:predicted transcriptional regulator
MGCTNSTKKQETDVGGRKLNEGGFKNRFHATTEFDISASESENEDEILSIKSINNNKQKLTKKIDGLTSGLTTTNQNSSTTTSSSLLDNRLIQTCV